MFAQEGLLRKRQRDLATQLGLNLQDFVEDDNEDANDAPLKEARIVPVTGIVSSFDSNETANTMPMDLGLDDDDLDPEGAEAERAAAEIFARDRQEQEHQDPLDYFDGEEGQREQDAEATDEPAEQPRPIVHDYSALDMLDERYTLAGEIFPTQYERPAPLPLVPGQDLVFQHVETTYDIDYRERAPVIRLWGVTAQGQSVLVEDRSFRPYFYAIIRTEEETTGLRLRLEQYLKERFHTTTVARKKATLAEGEEWRAPRPLDEYVLSMTPEPGVSMDGYHPPGKEADRFVKITVAYPKHVAAARDALEQSVFGKRYVTFEGNVPFELRYMIDQKIRGCQWLRLEADSFRVNRTKHSTAQYELTLEHGARPVPIDVDAQGDIGPMRFLSYDIEVLRKARGFPTADRDAVIMIACALNVAGQTPLTQHRVCFTLKPTQGTFLPFSSAAAKEDDGVIDQIVDPVKREKERKRQEERNGGPGIEKTTIYVFESERDLLMAFMQYVRKCDPDGLTGWNTDNFDMPYLAGRAEALGIYGQFMQFARIRDKRCWIREAKFESKAHGARATKELLCEGRFSYDGLLFLLRGQLTKYPSYKLNYISQVILEDQKLDVDYTQIPILYEGSDEDRTRLLWYCMKDTLLPLRLLEALMAVVNGVEQARVSGVPLKWLLSRGQGIKTDSALLREKEPQEHRPSRSPKPEHTAGGHVEEPRRGFYQCPIASLDFASLYPSIMIAFNICYTTLVSLEWARKNLKPDDYWVPYPSVDALTPEELLHRAAKKMTKKERERAKIEEDLAGKPVDFCFVKRHIRQGVLPRLLEKILGARAAVKGMLKKVNEDTDPLRHHVLDGRQLALKLMANSTYGYTKGHIFRNNKIMNAVTSYGRNMLGIVKATVLAPWDESTKQGGFTGRLAIDTVKCWAAGIDPEQEPEPGQPDRRIRTPCAPYVVYGDTDSVMIKFGDITLKECIAFGEEAAKMCTAKFPKPVSLAFEAVKLRALYLNRKRYAALQLERLIPGERYAAAIQRAIVSKTGTILKGLESKRRDNAPIGGGTQGEVLRILLHEADEAKAEQYVIKVISDLLMNRVDMSQLVITKGLTKTEEQYAKVRFQPFRFKQRCLNRAVSNLRV